MNADAAKRILELHLDALRKGEDLSYNEIANAVSQEFGVDISMTAVRGTIRRWRKKTFPKKDDDSTDIRRDLLHQFLRTTAKIKNQDDSPAQDRRRVIVIADLHGTPSKDILAEIIAVQPDLIVVAGDLLDSRASSPHPELNKAAKTIRQEILDVRAYLETILVETKCNILILRGNHDDWPKRRALEALAAYPDVLEFWSNPLDLLIEELPESRIGMINTVWQYHFADGSKMDLGESQYMTVLGDCLISHANFTGTNVGDAVRKLAAWINKWRGTLGLPDLTLLVQAHVHNVCLIEHDAGHQVWVEPGACFEPSVESYKVGYQPRWKPGAIGALQFIQYLRDGNWQTDLSSIQLIRPHRSREA